MNKPDLSLYLGRKVVSVIRGEEDNQWGIELTDGVKILNKHPLETIPPGDELVGARFMFISMSLRDTTLSFTAPNNHIHKVSFPPTYYVISDPVHGGEVYPQWDEELEDMGIPATPEGGISDKPQDEETWQAEWERLGNLRQARVQGELQDFLTDTEEK